MRRRAITLLVLLATSAGALAFPSARVALAAGGSWWSLSAGAAPSLLPARGEAQLLITVTNRGYAQADAGHERMTLTDTLPTGVKPLTYELHAGVAEKCAIAGQTITCEGTGTVPPYDAFTVLDIVVEMQEPQQAGLVNQARIEGGGNPSASLNQTLTLQHATSEATPFGLQDYEMIPESEDGETQTQAGSHPYQLTTLLEFNQRLEPIEVGGELHGAGHMPGEAGGSQPSVAALPRNLHVKLPPGLVGDPTATARCTAAQFELAQGINRCPTDSVVGVASAVLFDPGPYMLVRLTAPVFNLVPAPGEPARFGFIVENVPIILKTSLPTGGNYSVLASVEDLSQAVSVLSSEVTLWGVPGDARHDSARGWECLGSSESSCAPEQQSEPKALLTLPTSCEHQTGTQTSVSGQSWAAGPSYPEQSFTGQMASTPFPTMTGCESLAFEPSFAYTSESPLASTPSAFDGTLTIPQQGLLESEGRAPSALKETTITVPEGVQVNPSAANGLSACTEAQIGYTGQNTETGVYEFTPSAASCSESSKVATVTVHTPLLEAALTGGIYLAEPAPAGEDAKNPFNTLIAAYFIAQAPTDGILVKLAGYAQLNQTTGQVTLVFPGTPQVPFETLQANFLGGPRASTATPALCGSYTFHTSYAGWSGALTEPLASPPFQITAGPEGSACPQGHLPFAPSLSAGPRTPRAGALTPVVVKISHPDGDQALTGVSVTEPPGFAALLASVTPCQEPPPGQEWACEEDSRIGEARVYSGLGPEPVEVNGQAYLTTGYDGAPFGLLVRTLAQAGPFDLGWVNVRSRIEVSPTTAQVTISTDPGPRGEGVPTMLKGVPVQIKALEVAVNRSNFTFNPTNCTPMSFIGTLGGSESATSPVSAGFTAENCAALPFKPTFTASVKGRASKADGAQLAVKVTSAGLGQAGIAKTVVTLPKALPSRLSTIQKACLAKTFEANPASCDEGSLVGSATIHTPVFKNPLTGPAYLVSHGNAAFPDLEFVLQGEGVEIVLDGQTDIKKGVTTATFNSVPDAPFTSFETVFPTGPHSALTANVAETKKYNLCGESLVMPTTITGQNGAVIEQSTKIAIQGCGAVKATHTKKLTLAQQLKRALAKCRKKHKRAKAARVSCERQARRKYGAKKKAKRSSTRAAKHQDKA